MTTDRVGDTQQKVGDAPHLVDVSGQVDFPADGDKHKPGHVSEVDKYDADTGEPGGDSPTPPNEVHLVEHTSDGDDGLTPNERIAKGEKAVNKAPVNKAVKPGSVK